MPKLKIAIDAGHGSNTAGKRTPPFKKSITINGKPVVKVKKGEQYLEHYANVGVADLLYKNLIARGYEVIKTGWYDANPKDDTDESLSLRQSKVKNAKCDISVSIHFNASGDGTAFTNPKGLCIYIHTKDFADSNQLAEYALTELSKGTPQVVRGIYKNNLAMCNCRAMNTKASILCELAFMTNEFEAENLMINPNFWLECANELTDAIDHYTISNQTVVEKPKKTYKLYHTVTSSETLTQIAEKYKTTNAKLIKNNKIKDPDLLSIGEKLYILKYYYYTVNNTDTLKTISAKLLGSELRYPEIITINNLVSTKLYKNQILKIPD